MALSVSFKASSPCVGGGGAIVLTIPLRGPCFGLEGLSGALDLREARPLLCDPLGQFVTG